MPSAELDLVAAFWSRPRRAGAAALTYLSHSGIIRL